MMANQGQIVPIRPKYDLAELSIATVGGLAFALIVMFLCVVPLSGEITSGRDFVVFWATGQQLVHRANPYDAVAMDRIERHAGLAAGYGTMYMRNPPWALPLALPLGLVGLRVGALLWSLIVLACLLVSAWLMRAMHGSPKDRIHWLAISFIPALLCFFMGQTSLFSLLGLVLFLRLYRTHPFTAGVALWLCALKPHLFLPFGAVFLAWVMVSRSYKVLAGVAVSIAASCAITWLIDPSAWTDYSKLIGASDVKTQFIPCISVAMRLWINPRAMWLQYLPAALASIWAVVYYWRNRKLWDWTDHGNLLMLVSIAAAPYCWMYDQVLALPALLHAAYSSCSRHLVAVLALVNIPILIALMSKIQVTSAIWILSAPVWLGWYLLASASQPETI